MAVQEDGAVFDSASDVTAELTISWPSTSVALVEIARPHHLNALTPVLADHLRSTVESVALDPRCRAVILTGSGRGFCAGLDLASTAAATGGALRTVPERLGGQDRFAAMVRALRAAPVPVISAVNGPAAGAGFALALNSDVRIASTSASFHVASVRIGLSAGECGTSYLLPRLIGASRAFPILLSGRRVPAAEALGVGLVSDVVDDESLRAAAVELAESITTNSPYAVMATKQLMWANLDLSYSAAMDLENRTQILGTFTSDAVEAKQAFLEGRPPRFSGS